MDKRESFFNSDSNETHGANNHDKFFLLTNAIKDFENLFLNEKEGELYKFLLAAIEKPLIENILFRAEGNQLKAAKILGINRNTLHTKIEKLKIDPDDFKRVRLRRP